MPTPALLLLVAALLPLGVFVTLVGIGRRLGEPLAGVFATLVSAGSFACSIFALMAWLAGGAQSGRAWGAGKLPVLELTPWLPAGAGPTQGGWLDVGIYVDSLTVILFFMISAVSLIVHIFSIGYLRGDSRFSRYFALLGLFMFSMLSLVLSATLLQIFVFWEMVGLCSYLLISFWYERKSATRAATKAFVMNRIGDAGFMVGMGILFMTLGNLSLPALWTTLGNEHQSAMSHTLLTVTGLLVFCGAVGKSAQFPLHTWLPDAMEGPTPVSALIHAATMVAAGVYLVGRIYPILTPEARLVVAGVGCLTMVLGALVALVQTDIKRVLAYSTMSQLGLMMLGLGVGSWVGGLFHLITHGFFKALLFLGAGSVIDAAHHEQDMRKFGGLFTRIPVTAVTFFIGVLAIAGAPYFSGYLSKETILSHAGAFALLASSHGASDWVWVLFVAPVVVAYLTSFYMMRCWSMTFMGKSRDRAIADGASELPIMWLPLCGLAVFAIMAGYSWSPVKELTQSAMTEIKAIASGPPAGVGTTGAKGTTDDGAPFSGMDSAWPIESRASVESAPDGGEPAVGAVALLTPVESAHVRGEEMAHRYSGWAYLVGIGSAALVYGFGLRLPGALSRVAGVRTIRRVLLRKFYFDELYDALFFRTTRALAALCDLFDRHVIDACVNACARVMRSLSSLVAWNDRTLVDGAVDRITDAVWTVGDVLRSPQTGRVRLYVTVLMLACTVGLASVVAVVWLR